MDREFEGYAFLVATAFFTGIIGVIVRFVSGMNSTEIIFVRAIIAVATILLALAALGKLKQLKIVDAPRTLAIGALYCLGIFCFFNAFVLTSVSNAYLLFYCSPAAAAIMAYGLLGEKLSKNTVLGIALSIAGAAIVIGPANFSIQASQTPGNLAALAAGILLAASMIASKPLLKKTQAIYVCFWQYAITALLFIPFSLSVNQTQLAANWWQLAVLGIFCSAVAFTLFNEGVKRVRAQTAYVVTSIEVIIAAGLSALILSETLTSTIIAGGAAILAGVYLVTKKQA